ncbi:RNA-dependent RNA polymerase [Hubei dimarhabdovirus 1]|uniref:RNA-directed RNA polymerase L n=1 Tax=Hubei dimarhabdovirus 1 TaxID=2849739 RepID=A0A1L3KMY8_9RHAB|nr:RNA-dependent RNA polymerase [Hubei dimarhabdovirus 1]APG78744.1 RNA-dependent RNA polymerase [Hubei dimarhabdovirus 1]
MDYYENFENDYPCDPSDGYLDELPGLTETELLISKERAMTHLANVDYSLNSPLIADELDEMIRCARTGTRPDKASGLSLRYKVMEFVLGDFAEFRSCKRTSEFHHWFGSDNLKTNWKRTDFFQILTEAQGASVLTGEIVNAFLKGWLNKDPIPVPDKTQMPEGSLYWGTRFWELHKVTLMTNATSKNELSRLIKKFGGQLIPTETETDCILYPSPIFGDLYVFPGNIFMKDHRILLDRSTLLMMKDTYVARFNSFLAIYNRVDNLFSADAADQLAELYRIGDVILKEGGSKAYKSIKLLEPMCTSRIAFLAQKFRPLIPLFPKFEEHIKTSVSEQADVTPSIRDLHKLIQRTTDFEILLTFYGSFRHWGHPFVDYLKGLEKLYKQTHLLKTIDESYANKLASDLAYMVIKDQFNRNGSWPVDDFLIKDDHPLKFHTHENTWPTTQVIRNFGDNWHKLPLKKCFDIPDVIDPSIIYSDKSHSMTRKQVVKHLRTNQGAAIPSIKVLSTLLKQPATNWPKFLKQVNDTGISEDHLIIGLRAKERELKEEGRFFALMSWEIRDYFVMTEYLIKTHFVPLFKGLTMADDLTTVIGKILENTEGQGETGYENITVSNHIDYEKWNNHQRKEANNPVFDVMGKFLGYPNLISRTHEIFEKSWMYYNQRGDLIGVNRDGVIFNKDKNKRVCWIGQEGGLEGLRQKGWSICNLLVLRRESASVNTRVKVLAQGDNQVINSHYKLKTSRNDEQLINNIRDVIQNNDLLMRRVTDGTNRLGLLINQDETVQCTEFMNYGKNCVIRGNLRNLETKRWSRVTCVTNDQLPTMANIMSTTSSNALTVSHFSNSPFNSMFHYNFVGNLVRLVCEAHNPAIRSAISEALELQGDELTQLEYYIRTMYMDPSIGGVSGMSLTRFLVRAFPDPITESLTFAKLVYHNTTNLRIKKLMVSFGHPRIRVDQRDITKLIEDPLSLNIPRGIDATTMIKEQIKRSLYEESGTIGNSIIKSALKYSQMNEQGFLRHLRSIKPLFPRFLSEYYAATFFGMTSGLVGIFQNSKTIRNNFKTKLSYKYDGIITTSELYSLKNLLGMFVDKRAADTMWTCSAKRADQLRLHSWGSKVHGATVPHPAELFGPPNMVTAKCEDCWKPFPYRMFISVLIPKGFRNLTTERGTCAAYLGSSTSESTSILQSWEKEVKVHLMDRAGKLRNCIGWFVDREGEVAEGILGNLKALTGVDWSGSLTGFRRTGSAIHRFSCSRQSHSGYAAQNPSKLTRMISTTNSLVELGDQNYDFMFQNCLLNALLSVGEVHQSPGPGFYHQHIRCLHCLREIEEIQLKTNIKFTHKDVSQILEKWKPETTSWFKEITTIEIKGGNWDALTAGEKSLYVGIAQGFIYGDSQWSGNKLATDPALFPLTISKKVHPDNYFTGFIRGLLLSSLLLAIQQRRLPTIKSYYRNALGQVSLMIDKMKENVNILNNWRDEYFINLFCSVPHQIPPSYPMMSEDIGMLGSNYLKYRLSQYGLKELSSAVLFNQLWIFSDLYRSNIVGLFGIATRCQRLLAKDIWNKSTKEELKTLRQTAVAVREQVMLTEQEKDLLLRLVSHVYYTDREIRHAVKGLETLRPNLVKTDLVWGEEYCCTVTGVTVFCSPLPYIPPLPSVPRVQNPLISGLRLTQLATGSHYKMRGILNELGVCPRGAIIGGDGSGGLSALVLRMYPIVKILFNSLCVYDKVYLKGNNPSPPSAITHTLTDPGRCVNLYDAWRHPNDLREIDTWNYFCETIREHRIVCDLIILDMEVTDDESIDLIENHLHDYISNLLTSAGTLIFKTYLSRVFSGKTNILDKLINVFSSLTLYWTELTSSESSEVYVVMSGIKTHRPGYQVFVDYNSLIRDTKLAPCFRGALKEFDRAVKIPTNLLTRGIPAQLLVDPSTELIKTLTRIGLRSDISFRYLEQYGNFKKPSESFPLFVLVVSYLTGIHLSRVSSPGPLSDGGVSNLGCWIAAYLIWIGYKSKHYYVYKLGQEFINKYFPYSHRIFKVGMNFFSGFSLTETKDTRKFVQLDSKMALIGSIIRNLTRFYDKPGCFNINQDYCNSILVTINPAITTRILNSRTGLMDLLMKCNTYKIPRIAIEDIRIISDDYEVRTHQLRD